jgi:hypothetical protein
VLASDSEEILMRHSQQGHGGGRSKLPALEGLGMLWNDLDAAAVANEWWEMGCCGGCHWDHSGYRLCGMCIGGSGQKFNMKPNNKQKT